MSDSENDPLLCLDKAFSRRAFVRAGFFGLCGLSLFSSPLWALDEGPLRKPSAPRTLVLDAGHGGHDPGAIGVSGLQEKDVTLEIVRHMAALLEGSKRIRVRLTRDKDVFLPLDERVAIAQGHKADLFVSIHADSAPNAGARGLSVYTLSDKASDKLADSLAEQENKAGRSLGVDLSHADKQVAAILYDLTARRTCNTSQRAKAAFIRLIESHWRLLENPMRSANFAVLRAPDIPSMLVETGFLSNPEDSRLLGIPAQRTKIAHAMANEIAKILDSPIFS